MKQVDWVVWEGRRAQQAGAEGKPAMLRCSGPLNGALIPDAGQTLNHGWQLG